MPSLHPSPELLGPFIEGAVAQGFTRIIVVDDGSGPEYADVFDDIVRRFGVVLLRHPNDRGKGRALKTAIEHIAANEPTAEVVVTADSDGQHAPGDLVRVAERALDDLRLGRPTVVLGVRTFEGRIDPSQEQVGQQVDERDSAAAVRSPTRRHTDGSAGLSVGDRREVRPRQGERFDYEMNVLLWLLATRQSIDEVPIDTIYHDLSNSVSHFRPVVDSTRVYAVILRQFLKFSGASIASAVLDLAVYVVLLDFVFANDRMRVPHRDRGRRRARGQLGVQLLGQQVAGLSRHVRPRARLSLRYALLAVAILAVVRARRRPRWPSSAAATSCGPRSSSTGRCSWRAT